MNIQTLNKNVTKQKLPHLLRQNQRFLFDQLATKWNLKSFDDWYKVDKTMYSDEMHVTLKKHFNGSLFAALNTIYPEHSWIPWRFTSLPSGYWKSVDNQREYLSWLEKQLNISSLDDWYNVSFEDVVQRGGSTFISSYTHLQKALSVVSLNSMTRVSSRILVYPEHPWKAFLFKGGVPKGYWDSLVNQRDYFDWLGRQLGVKSLDDWYSVKVSDVKEKGGFGLLQHYSSSLTRALRAVYPDHDWKIWKFEAAPKGFWESDTNQRQFFDAIAKELNVQQSSDWYKVKFKDVVDFGGSQVLKIHGSLSKALSVIYPENMWYTWQFAQVPKGYWDDLSNQREYFDWLAGQLNVKRPDDWYQIKLSDVEANHGAGLLHHYGNSLVKALPNVYPEYQWQEWKFTQVSKGYWDKLENQKKFMESLSKDLGISTASEWHNVSVRYLQKQKGSTLVQKSGGLIPLLSNHFPSHNFKQPLHKATSPSKIQMFLHRLLQQLLPKHKVHLEYRDQNFIFSKSQRKMVLDVYVPDLKLAFEYQGGQHYNWHFLYGTPEEPQHRDRQKRDTLEKLGITLIDIPYWWDEQRASLVATIHKHRPDIFSDPGLGTPISVEAPPKQVNPQPKTYAEIPLCSAVPWKDTLDPTGWLLSEKLAGVRVYYDGRGRLYMRNGTQVMCPSDIVKGLPLSPLDGVLVGRDPNTCWELISRHISDSIQWKGTSFVIVDVPTHHHLRFEERLKMLKQIIPSGHPYAKIVSFVQCNGKEHLASMLQQVKEKEGEGIILRRPRSFYHDKDSLCQMLVFQEAKCKVISILDNHVRVNGKQFTLMVEPVFKPAIGTVLSVKHGGLAGDGSPFSPVLLHERPDLIWQQLLFNEEETPYYVTIGKSSGPVPKCRGCKRELKDRSELRVQATVIFNPPGSGPYPGKASFCLNVDCIQLALREYTQKGIYLPPFNNKLVLTNGLHQSQVPDLKHIEWVNKQQ